MNRSPADIPQPGRLGLLTEARAIIDLARMVVPLLGAQFSRGRPRELAVILVPGFGTDERYFAPLRHFLGRRGFLAEGWGLGRNAAGVDLAHRLEDLSDGWEIEPRPGYRGEASVPYLCDRFGERVRERHRELGKPIALVGWSLGGYLCREVARDLPEIVDRVITLGSPTVGGPKYTAAAPFFRKRGMDLDWIEEEIARREKRPIIQPITAIYSKRDGVVSWQATIDHHSPNVRHVEVGAPHLGLGFNPEVWAAVLEALEAPGPTAGS
jgi:pimeloyl-ACP methyl ester carboxylesterase